MGQKQFLNVEFSWGRWNGDDIKDMLEPMQIVATRLSQCPLHFVAMITVLTSKTGALNGFAKVMNNPFSPGSKQDDTESVSESDTSDNTAVDDTFLLRQFRERNIAAEHEHNVRLVDVLPSIQEATAELRTAAVGALSALQALIVAVNTNRYRRGHALQDTRLAELDAALSTLRAAQENFKTDRRLVLLQPYRDVMDKLEMGAVNKIPLRALYQSFVFAANLAAACNGIVMLAEQVSGTAARRTRARLWAPKGLRAIVKLLRSSDGAGKGAVGEDAQPEQAVESEEKKEYSECGDLERGKVN